MTNTDDILITICITHFNDADFILSTLYCLKNLTKNSYRVIVRDNNSQIRFYQKLKSGIKNYKNVQLYQVENFNWSGSLAHGTALNDLVKRIDTPYGVILDADCTFLIKNWDEILINQLNDKIKIIGTQASRNEPRDFPSIVAILFETETFKKLNVDFRPKDILYEDTGYEMREKYLKAGFQGKIIEMKDTRTYKKGPFANIICAEYYLNGYNHIFASHFGRGSSWGEHKYRKGTSFIYRIPKISKLLRRIKGKREAQEWIKICKGIVDRQV